MKNTSRLFLIANGIMAALFVIAAALQYNDPDVVQWGAVYGIAALACGAFFMNRLHWAVPALVGAVALVWAATLAPNVIGKVSVRDTFRTMRMTNPAIELAREMGGLLIATAWMITLTVKTRGRSGRR